MRFKKREITIAINQSFTNNKDLISKYEDKIKNLRNKTQSKDAIINFLENEIKDLQEENINLRHQIQRSIPFEDIKEDYIRFQDILQIK